MCSTKSNIIKCQKMYWAQMTLKGLECFSFIWILMLLIEILKNVYLKVT